MTPLQISGLLGQWVGLSIVLGAVIICLIGINIEYKYKAPRGLRFITVGSVIFGIGSFIFALATKLLGF